MRCRFKSWVGKIRGEGIGYPLQYFYASLVAQLIKNLPSANKESACNAGDLGLIPRLGRSPGEGNGKPLQYSSLENSTQRYSLQQSMVLKRGRDNWETYTFIKVLRPLKQRWVALPSSSYSSKGREGAWADGETESWGLFSSHGCIVNFTHCVTLGRSPYLSGYLICENEIKLELTLQSCYEE